MRQASSTFSPSPSRPSPPCPSHPVAMFQDSLLHPRPPWLVQAFLALARHEFLTALQLAARFALRHPEVVEAIEALVTEGLLQRLVPPPNLRGDVAASAYSLTRAGAELLTHAVERIVRLPPRRRTLLTLTHDLGRNSFALALERLDERGRLRLLGFETRRTRLADVVHVAERGRPLRIPLVADGLAVVEVGGEVTGLLLEQDRGTVSIERMRRKFLGYDAWWREGGPERRFGLRSLRVVTVAPTQARLQRLREAALAATGNRGSKLFWFALDEDVSVEAPERLLGPAWWVCGHDGERRPLFDSVPTEAAA